MMENKTSGAASINQLLFNRTEEQKQILAEARPFMIVLTVIMVIVSVLVIINSPEPWNIGQFLLFAVVFSVHVGLHWLSGYGESYKKFRLPYLIIQGVLAFSIGIISGAPTLVLAAFCALIGETLGTYGISRLAWGAVLVYLGAMPFSYWLIGGQETLDSWIPPTISTSIILIIFMVMFRIQVNASTRAQALADELEVANRQLADYASQVEDLTITAERQRMARELHDTLAQGVAGLVLQLEAMKAHQAAGREERVASIIDQALVRARSTLADSRAAIDDLRAVPASLKEAIKAKTERFTRATGIPCEVAINFGDAAPRPETGDHFLRILSEALANVTRHAQASHVSVRLETKDGQFDFEIRDDGEGFDPDSSSKAGHYGLLGMRERARLLGGSLQIDSGPGEGTRIRLVVPVPKGVAP